MTTPSRRDGHPTRADGGGDPAPSTEAGRPDGASPATTLRSMCYDGERVVEGVGFDGGAVAVTSHRLLTLTPPTDDEGGPALDGDSSDATRFRAVALPNVTGVDVGSTGRTAHAYRAVRYGIYALVLLAASVLLNFDGLIRPIDAPAGTALGPVVGLVSLAAGALALVDDVLLITGLLVLAAALGFGGWYLRGRRQHVAVEVAGDDPVRLPAAGFDDAAAAATRLEGVVAEAREERTAGAREGASRHGGG
jgi:hypothetical protein